MASLAELARAARHCTQQRGLVASCKRLPGTLLRPPGHVHSTRALATLSNGTPHYSWIHKAQVVHDLWQKARSPARLPAPLAREIAAILCSTHGLELTALKEVLNSEWGVHDLDSLLFVAFRRFPGLQAKVLQHFATDSQKHFCHTDNLAASETHSARPLQVVADFDDTLQANWLDRRVPRRTVYPGAMQFLREIRLTSPAEAPIVRLDDASVSSVVEGRGPAARRPSWPQILAQTAVHQQAEAEQSQEHGASIVARGRLHLQRLQQRWRRHELPAGAVQGGAAHPTQVLPELLHTASASSDDDSDTEGEHGGAWHTDDALDASSGMGRHTGLYSAQVARAVERCIPMEPLSQPDCAPEHLPLGGLLVLTARPAGVRNFVKSRTQGHLSALGLEPVSVLTGGVMHLATGRAIAEKKLQNLEKFLALFPEMDVTLLGDAGQADAAFISAAMQQHGVRVRGAFVHNVTPTKAHTGDGGSKEQYTASGMHFFDTYIGGAAAALRGGVLTPPAALRVAAAAALECSLLCAGTSVQPMLHDMDAAMVAAGYSQRLPPTEALQEAVGVQGGVARGKLRSSLRQARWQPKLQRYTDALRRDLERLVSSLEVQC